MDIAFQMFTVTSAEEPQPKVPHPPLSFVLAPVGGEAKEESKKEAGRCIVARVKSAGTGMLEQGGYVSLKVDLCCCCLRVCRRC